MKILDYLKDNFLVFDGAMGSLLQQNGLKAGDLPEEWNISRADVICDIHQNYILSGANVITTNTFGANGLKMKHAKYTLREMIVASIQNVNKARALFPEKKIFIAYDIGPLGSLLKPSGLLSFDEAYAYYKEIVDIIKNEEIDIVVAETCSDLYEMKACVLATKENSSLPIISTLTFEEDGRTLAGNDVSSVVATLEGLGVDGLGLNCGFGPKEMIAIIKEFESCSSIPLLVQPNAGMPAMVKGELNYDVNEFEFLEYMKEVIGTPVQMVGGCCGTTYKYIKELRCYVDTCSFQSPRYKENSVCSSGVKSVLFDKKIIQIGERINPTGKSLLKQAIMNEDYNYIVKEALAQEDEGADVLDINVGLPKIDEASIMINTIEQVQTYTSLPLQIDSSSVEVLEAGMRYYNGKAMVNSVNGKEDNLKEVLPLVKKYGGILIGLCIDENGLAYTCEEKLHVAKKIVETALIYGIHRKDIIIDPLTLTASAQQKDVKATIDAVYQIKQQLGVKTSLGISNVSFGLPQRDIMTEHFLTMCIYAGLDACIVNTKSKWIQNAIKTSNVIMNYDEDCKDYIQYSEGIQEIKNETQKIELNLQEAIQLGLKDDVSYITKKLLETREPLDIIEHEIVLALNEVGTKFEQKKIFLPQLIQSAESVSFSFSEIKKYYAKHNQEEKKQEQIILATVEGDVHDIGKNIVRVLLENYGYDVIDLGKDVPFSKIREALEQSDAKLVGLSALMTTTVVNMEKIIKEIHLYNPDIKVMVGGAVLTSEYAKQIGSDYYCKDALESVKVAKIIYS